MKATQQNSTFQVLLSRGFHQTAQQFHQQHSQGHKAKQVYLNTLAVCAVNYYLKCFGIETDLEANDSWDAVMQTLADTADLVVKDVGKLECRPVMPDSTICHVPAEVWSERIGYVAVQLNESLSEATLLGFVEKVETEELPISRLQPLEDLPGYLEQISPISEVVRLLNWFDNIFEAGWQSIEALLVKPTDNFAFGVRSGTQLRKTPIVKRAKLIDLGIQLGNRSVVLLVAIAPSEEEKVSVQIQAHPVKGEKYLPPNLRLTLFSEVGETLQEVSSRDTDKLIQLPPLKCYAGESFSVGVALDDVSIVENFAI